MKKQPLVVSLEKLGVDMTPPIEHTHCKFTSPSLMPLVIEKWPHNKDWYYMSVANYGEQAGDLMCDPDIMFMVVDGKLYPYSYQNDYLGIYNMCEGRPTMQRDILSFCNTWARQIREARYTLAE